MTSIAAVQSRALELQGMIDSISVGRTAPAETRAAENSAAAGTAFDSVLTQALAATSSTAAGTGGSRVSSDGNLTVGGLSLDEFATAEVTPGSGMDVLQRAMTHLGVPYVWGGNGPNGFDCSGLVKYVMNEMGISVPRKAAAQGTVGTAVPSLAEAMPGDLVVTRGGGHIGIYVGGDQMLHAPRPGESVKIGKIYGDILTIRRLVPPGEVQTSQAASAAQGTAQASAPAAAQSTEAVLGRVLLQALSSSSQTPALANAQLGGLNLGTGTSGALANLSLAALGSSL